MFLYVVMAGWSAIALGYNTRLSAMMAQAIAPTGALMTLIALVTGAFWGRPTWGTYWAWDARMTSELILLFLYLGVIALRNAIDDPRRADRACAVRRSPASSTSPSSTSRCNGGTRCTRARR
jgi:heme exporter protein C